MGNSQSSYQTCFNCKEPFAYHGTVTEGAEVRCQKCTLKPFSCSQCKQTFLSEIPTSYNKKQEIVCKRCGEKKREIICSSCGTKVVVYEDHGDKQVNCLKCAEIQADLIKNGSYERFKAVRITDREVSLTCPKGIVTKHEEIVFVINRFGQLQIRDGDDEVGAQPQ